MSNRLPTGASEERAALDAASGSQPTVKGAAVALDRTHSGRRNRLLAALPPADLALLMPHLKDVVLEQGVVLQEQGERVDQVYFPHDGIISLLAVMRQG